MSNKPNLMGKRFGKLTVIAEVGRYSTGEVKWLCKCECGQERLAKTYYLKRGVKSCVQCNYTDYTGQVIGRLTVLKRTDDKVLQNGQKRIQWECRCECGSIVTRDSAKLKRGRCCCKQCKASIDKENNSRGYEGISGTYWTSLLRQAGLRNLPFKITIHEAWRLYLKQNGKCALSGTDIEFARTKQEYLQGKTTASLDRINSSSGYTKNNVQWVHKWINKMKSNHSQERFLSLCANVCNYQTHSKKRKVKQKLLRPPFKIHGGKRYLRTWVVGHFPVGYTEMTYVEPYVGAASVLLNKRRSSNELVVDLDPGVIAILTTIRDHSSEFIAKLNETPYCKEVFLEAMTKQHFKTSMDYVVNEMTLRRMSRGGLKKSFSWSARKRGGRPGDENAWKTLIEHLPDISRRLEGVTIERDTAINVINRHKDDPNALFYCDPTYLPETRRSKDTYEFEVSEEEHIELCRVLQSIKGKALISGYHSPLYDDLLRGWKMETKQIANHSSQQKKKQYRTECLWANFSHNQPRNIT